MTKNINQGKKEIIRITRYGPIKLIFPKEDNPKAVNTTLDNLLTTYEKRIYTDKQNNSREGNDNVTNKH